MEYMGSDAFRPEYDLDISLIRDLFTKPTPRVDMFTKDNPEELKPIQGAK